MNLQSWIQSVAGAHQGAASTGLFRQIRRDGLSYARRMKCSHLRACGAAAGLAGALWFAGSTPVLGQTIYYQANGTEYSAVGALPGDQVFPDAAIGTTNGILVWQDNATDGDGWGISARRLDSTLSGTLSNFRVNVTGAGDQENPRVALLNSGGAVFVWQGGSEGNQHIYARFLTASNTFLTSTDLLVSTFSNARSFQLNPAVAALKGGNVVVAWSSFNQAGSNSLQDVYAKILSPSGATVVSEFLVNQFTNYNQRTPSVAALPGGGFAVAWVTEQQQQLITDLSTNSSGLSSVYVGATSTQNPSVNIYARLFQSTGAAVGGEFRVDTGSAPCANPSVAAATDGSFMVAWSGYDLTNRTNAWDVFARPFSSAGVGGTTLQLNAYVRNQQSVPRLSAIGLDYLAAWTSLGQDGSAEGVYGQYVHNDGTLVGNEFRINTTTISRQMQPVVTSDGNQQFLAVWTSFTGNNTSFDLFAQRYINVASVPQAMSAPYVWAPFVLANNAYVPQLVVSWSPLLGLSVSNYEVYADGATTPTAVVTSNSWVMTAANGLAAGTTHTFAVDYVTTSNHRSPLSPITTAATWSGLNDSGIPSEWMQQYYGTSVSGWPQNVNAPLVPGGPSLLQVFVSGGNPKDPSTWLHQQLVRTGQGIFLTWNTQAGATYQVQVSSNLSTWTNLGSARFAAGTTDSLNVAGNRASYYRVLLLRQ